MISLLKALQGKRVALDTMIFIYPFEEHPLYLPLLKPFFGEVEKGNILAFTSTLSLTECLVQPFRAKALELAARYKTLFYHFPHLSVIAVDTEIAERAAWLRSQYRLRTPDAIQIATGIASACQVFLTNDERLPQVEEIQIRVLNDFL